MIAIDGQNLPLIQSVKQRFKDARRTGKAHGALIEAFYEEGKDGSVKMTFFLRYLGGDAIEMGKRLGQQIFMGASFEMGIEERENNGKRFSQIELLKSGRSDNE